jgi:hypothetical protein
MHHSLKFYSRRRRGILKLYMFLAAWTKVPLLGRLVRWAANNYGRNMEGAYLLTTAEAVSIVESAAGIAAGPCTCREVFQNCANPRNVELLLGPSREVFMKDEPGSREISREEAKQILEDCHRRGLIHTLIECRKEFYAICNCCTCCCVPLRLKNRYGIGDALRRHPDIVGAFRAHQAAHVADAKNS